MEPPIPGAMPDPEPDVVTELPEPGFEPVPAGDAADMPLFGFGADTGDDGNAVRRRGRKRRGRALPVLSLLLVLALVVGGFFAVRKIQDYFSVADYTGAGSGTTSIRVNPGDGAGDVAATLAKAGVVKSARAFTRAAEKSGKAGDIQPGLYRLPLHASGDAALAALLNPSNLLVTKVTIPEGRTAKQILDTLAARTGLPLADLKRAASGLGELGLPKSMSPTSIEGFLFPATYEFDPSQSPLEVVQALTETFNTTWVTLGMDSKAASLHLKPYQLLVMASMIESEARFQVDRPKIARVILNRLAAGMPLGIDAASRYGAALKGLDPNSVDYATINSPFNTYLHKGLPPTPISNPGEASLKAAAAPASGDWLYYVVADAEGHHFFTNDEAEFEQAVQRCRDNNWGC